MIKRVVAWYINLKEVKKVKWLFIIATILSSPLIFMIIIGGVKSCCIPFASGNKPKITMLIELLRCKTLFLRDWRLQIALAAPVQFIIGFRIYKKAFSELKLKKVDRNLLVAVGSTTIFLYSLYVSILGFADTNGIKKVYYVDSMFIITISLFLEYLDISIKNKLMLSIKKSIEYTGKLGEFQKEELYKSINIFEIEKKNKGSIIEKRWNLAYSLFNLIVLFIALLIFIIWYCYIFNQSFYFIEKPIRFAVAVLIVAAPYAINISDSILLVVDLKIKVAIILKDELQLENYLKEKELAQRLSKYSISKIKQNVFITFLYSIIVIPIAFTGKISPEIAAVLMLSISIIVILNSLRVKRT